MLNAERDTTIAVQQAATRSRDYDKAGRTASELRIQSAPVHEVQKLIAGPTVYICNECVDLCNQILQETNAEWSKRSPGERDKLLLFTVTECNNASHGCILEPGYLITGAAGSLPPGTPLELRYPEGTVITAELGAFSDVPARRRLVLLHVKDVPPGTEVWAV